MVNAEDEIKISVSDSAEAIDDRTSLHFASERNDALFCPGPDEAVSQRILAGISIASASRTGRVVSAALKWPSAWSSDKVRLSSEPSTTNSLSAVSSHRVTSSVNKRLGTPSGIHCLMERHNALAVLSQNFKRMRCQNELQILGGIQL